MAMEMQWSHEAVFRIIIMQRKDNHFPMHQRRVFILDHSIVNAFQYQCCVVHKIVSEILFTVLRKFRHCADAKIM
jgi:hypothetical protein